MGKSLNVLSMEQLRGRRNVFFGVLAVMLVVAIGSIGTAGYLIAIGKDARETLIALAPLLCMVATATPLMIQVGMINKELAARGTQQQTSTEE